jgi:hypothetical protein
MVALGRAKVTGVSGKTAKIKVKLSRKALGKLREATKRGKAEVVLTVRATDDSGNRAAASRQALAGAVRLRLLVGRRNQDDVPRAGASQGERQRGGAALGALGATS